MLLREACPACGSSRYKNNDHTRHGKQNHQCNACERQFVATAEDHRIAGEQRTMMEHLLREGISLRGLCRAEKRSGFFHPCLLPSPVALRASCEGTSMAFSGAFIWTPPVSDAPQCGVQSNWTLHHARETKTCQVIAFHGGDRSRESAKERWGKLPLVYREQATFHTDHYEAYRGVMPAEQHQAITKHARKTNPMERFHKTLRQRVARLVRETLSFSKKLAHHIGAIKYLICSYNLTKAPVPA